ncbi:MAG: ubiquinone biosynthesis protein COQ4 [Myxococcota bacterium]
MHTTSLDRVTAWPRILLHMVWYALDRESHLQSAFDMDDLTRHLRASDESLRRICEDPLSRVRITARFTDLNVDLERFRGLADGTLGRELARLYEGGGFEPDLTRPERLLPRCDKSYILYRLRQCHDIWHVLTGFDTSHEGEVGLQGFSLAQLHSPTSAIALAGTTIDMLFGPFDAQRIGGTMSALTIGWEMGKRARPMFPIDWDAYWERPLASLREELGITPADMHRIAHAA